MKIEQDSSCSNVINKLQVDINVDMEGFSSAKMILSIGDKSPDYLVLRCQLQAQTYNEFKNGINMLQET